MKRRKLKHDLIWFISNGEKIHNKVYSYNKSIYTGIKNKLIIICNEHGEFIQTPDAHINKHRGCPKCGINTQVRKRTLSLTEFKRKAIIIHENRYSYEKVEYDSYHKKIIITCKTHGDFLQRPSSHLWGSGCPKCKKDLLRIKFSRNTNWFIQKSQIIHNNRYLYDKVEYKNNSSPIIIICKIHGEYKQHPNSHLKGSGCPLCAFNVASENKTLTTEDFNLKAISVHGNRYDYSKANYIASNIKILIICPLHGEFSQTPNSHLTGSNCPKCVNCGPSKSEKKIMKILNENNIEYVFQKRFYDCRNPKTNYMLPFDFYLPNENILIEYDGPQHFTDTSYKGWDSLKYIQYKDSIKNEYCKNNNIKLLRISYKENINFCLITFGIINKQSLIY